jgi:beta-galactosidase
MRCLKGGRPFMLMESTPTFSNWHEVHKLKRPGMHLASSLLAIAHGSETVQYFQWRKSRGSWEKFHGAVVDHAGRADTRVFAEVRQVGQALQRLQEVAGSSVPAEVAIVFDWENRWALEEASGLRLEAEKGYEHTCKAHHDPLWRLGVPVDVVNEEADLSGYRLVIAPMLYMVRPGVAESLEGFVRGGGTLVLTYWSGIVDENDLCFLGGFPGPLRSLLGIRSEEIDGLYPWQSNLLCLRPRNPLGLSGEYQVGDFCDLVRVESAQVLAEYGRDFYRGRPALTANRFGAGSAYYLASRTEGRFLEDFYGALVRMLALRRALSASFPEGVSAQLRRAGERQFIFLFNFDEQEHLVELGPGRYLEKLSGRSVAGSLRLEGYGVRVLQG